MTEKKKSATKKTVAAKKAVAGKKAEVRKKDGKALWGIRLLIILIVAVIVIAVGMAMSHETEDTERRTGGPMYGIEIASNGVDKFIMYGKKTVMRFENNGDEYEVNKYLVDLTEKKAWFLINRYDVNDELIAENAYVDERELSDEDVEKIKSLFEEIQEKESELSKEIEGRHPYVLVAGEKEVKIYPRTMVDRIVEAIGFPVNLAYGETEADY